MVQVVSKGVSLTMLHYRCIVQQGSEFDTVKVLYLKCFLYYKWYNTIGDIIISVSPPALSLWYTENNKIVKSKIKVF